MDPAARWTIAIAAAYLIGSIPFGLMIGLARGIDIREHGSRNIGATNTMRVLGRPWGILCFILDLGKGCGPAVGFGAWMGVLGDPDPPATDAWLWLALAAAAVIGHMLPVWLKFRGGKGVATGFGAMIGLWPFVTLPAAAALIVWLAVLKAWRYVSIASCSAAVAVPAVLAALLATGWPTGAGDTPAQRLATGAPFLVVTALLGALVIWKHRGNLARIRAGTEPKTGGTPRAGA